MLIFCLNYELRSTDILAQNILAQNILAHLSLRKTMRNPQSPTQPPSSTIKLLESQPLVMV